LGWIGLNGLRNGGSGRLAQLGDLLEEIARRGVVDLVVGGAADPDRQVEVLLGLVVLLALEVYVRGRSSIVY
jgi:hypothetical protein